MAIYKGKDLMVMADGVVIAASKSCTVNVECDDIPVSSPTDGQWEHVIAGRKKWKVTTNHLVPNVMGNHMSMEACSKSWGDTDPAPMVRIGSQTFNLNVGRGLTLLCFRLVDGAYQIVWQYTYDTYNDTDVADEFCDDIGYYGDATDIRVIVSRDAFLLDNNMRQAISNTLHIPIDAIPTITNTQGAFAAIGQMSSNTNGICMGAEGKAGAVNVKAYFLDGNNIFRFDHTLKDMLSKVGNIVTLSLLMNGDGSDRVSGQALCTTFQTTATLGNLLTGGYTFKGSGPLE